MKKQYYLYLSKLEYNTLNCSVALKHTEAYLELIWQSKLGRSYTYIKNCKS